MEIMEQRLVEEMAKLRGGKRRLREIKAEYEIHIGRLRVQLSQYESTIRQIGLLTAGAEDPVDSGAE